MLKDTIISAFNYDGTLLKWLKKVEDALQNASASEFRVNKKGNATISFSIVFANGDTLESGDIILQQGESVTDATIRQGHLILTLSNGDELDAGDLGAVTGFSINESQHLIVTYQNGTSQDLGAIFSGNVVINGNINVDGAVSTPILTSENDNIEAQKPVIEVMSGYRFFDYDAGVLFAGVVKNGNKLTLSVFGKIQKPESEDLVTIGNFELPQNIASKIVGGFAGTLYCDLKKLYCVDGLRTGVEVVALLYKMQSGSNRLRLNAYNTHLLTAGVDYFYRYEVTFLLSNNLA